MMKSFLLSFAAASLFVLAVLATPVYTQAPGRGRGAAATLPDGAGKDIVQTQCTKCHALGLIANSGGYTRPGWEDLIGTMVMLPPDQKTQVATYLATNFPEQPRPPAVVLPGPVNVPIKEWTVPTLGSRPHDPEPGPGGTIWWTGMFANVIGRFDTRTEQVEEFPVNTPASGPHG